MEHIETPSVIMNMSLTLMSSRYSTCVSFLRQNKDEDKFGLNKFLL